MATFIAHCTKRQAKTPKCGLSCLLFFPNTGSAAAVRTVQNARSLTECVHYPACTNAFYSFSKPRTGGAAHSVSGTLQHIAEKSEHAARTF
jgi:hypothetical protein